MKRFWFVFLAILAGCTSMRQDPFMQVQPGMEAYQVQQLLGDPLDRKFTADHEEWMYRKQVGKGDAKPKIIIFDQKRVVGLADDEISAQRQFELARAQASAPRVIDPYRNQQNLQAPMVGTSSGFMGGALLCTGHNKYGDYAEGGGCNEFGCWAPGGSCNQHGCTLRGECSEKECKDKAPSYQCVKRN